MSNLIFSCINSRIENDLSIYSSFKLGPFTRGQALTFGTALRRTLLFDLSGLSIVFVQIEGVDHEYSTLEGVSESVLEILTNLKQIKFGASQPFYKPVVAYLDVLGPKTLYSCDLNLPQQLKCLDSNQYIATIACDGQLKMKIFICQGRRYVLQNVVKSILQKQFKKILSLKNSNYLFLDAIFLPITKVNFTIEENPLLFEEFIILEIWTNGSLHPREAINQAINEVIQILLPFRTITSKKDKFLKIELSTKVRTDKKKFKLLKKINSNKLRHQFYRLDIGNLNLSLYAYSYLKKNNIHLIGDLLALRKNDFSSSPEVALEIQNCLFELGLKLQK